MDYNNLNSLPSNPDIIECLSRPLTYTPFDVKWFPYSSKIVDAGQTPRSNGIVQIYNLLNGKLELFSEFLKSNGFKCMTFGSSSFASRDLAVGDFEGNLYVYDLERGSPSFEMKKAHKLIINAIDGIGGSTNRKGPPEIVTASRDGTAKVWDVRMKKQAMLLDQHDKTAQHECWAVSFGNAYSQSNRDVCLGYDNGDVKLFDIKMNKVIWETNLKQGICSIEFDKKDCQMDKLAVTTLESKVVIFNMVTYHPELGFSYLNDTVHSSTIWGTKFLPQNKDTFISMGGNGGVSLYKYIYPMKKFILDENNMPKGNVGTLSIIKTKKISSQPIVGFDWHQEKTGLASLISLDNTLKVFYFTKLTTI